MAPTLETPDGQAVDADKVNAEFDRAMNDDGPDTQAPPRRGPRAVPEPAETPAKRRGRPPKADQPRTVSQAAHGPLSDGERAQGVKGLAQIGAGLALMLGKATRKDAFKADAVTIASSAEEIADACVQTAKADAKFAAALDKVCSAGPYAALITVGVQVASQCARNHKPGLSIPGTVDPAELLKAQDEAEAASVPAAA